MLKIAKYVVYDILRSKVLLAYTLFLLLIALSLFSFQSDAAKSLVSLMSVVLIVVPLVSIFFSTTYFYNAYEFMELLVSQPISRNSIFLGEFFGVAFSLLLATLAGTGVPMAIYAFGATGFSLLFSAAMLTLIFTALAFLASVATRDKARGIGVSLMLWFYFSVIYDALVLVILFSFSDYPLDKAVIALASLNPIDLSRILVLLQMDISALMGFTGAVYKEFFGQNFGLFYSIAVLLLWIVLPLLLSLKIFKRKNL